MQAQMSTILSNSSVKLICNFTCGIHSFIAQLSDSQNINLNKHYKILEWRAKVEHNLLVEFIAK